MPASAQPKSRGRMGVPIRGFRIATNRNDILHRLFTTGTYRAAEVTPSLAPSMDIQAASNFERFVYYSSGGDAERFDLAATAAIFANDADHCSLGALNQMG